MPHVCQHVTAAAAVWVITMRVVLVVLVVVQAMVGWVVMVVMSSMIVVVPMSQPLDPLLLLPAGCGGCVRPGGGGGQGEPGHAAAARHWQVGSCVEVACISAAVVRSQADVQVALMRAVTCTHPAEQRMC
jgi:hypothetical protein